MTEFLIGVLVGMLLGATPMAILARMSRAQLEMRSGEAAPIPKPTSNTGA